MTVLLNNNGNSFHCRIFTCSVTTCFFVFCFFSSIFFLPLSFSLFSCWICCQLPTSRGFRAWDALLYDKSQAGQGGKKSNQINPVRGLHSSAVSSEMICQRNSSLAAGFCLFYRLLQCQNCHLKKGKQANNNNLKGCFPSQKTDRE